MFNKAQSILVVAAHPDDEMLGCGGTLARFAAQGAKITILLLGEGPLSREGSSAEQQDAHTHALKSANAAAESLGITDVRFGNLPDNAFDSVPLLDIVKTIEAVAETIQPDLVLTHHFGDLNIDHELTHRAVMTAFRPLPGARASTILGFEILSSTEYATPCAATAFTPNVYVDISNFLEQKQRALQQYETEMRNWPHPRSYKGVEYLARLRGCHCGKDAAEAFVLCREIL